MFKDIAPQKVQHESDDPRKPLSIGIGMLLQLHRAREKYSTRFPATEAELDDELKRMAELLRKYGSRLLRGDLRDFDQAGKIEAALAKKFGPQTPSSGDQK